ncbi:MBL fold metallo-hydrolase [Paenibacillus sp. UNC499MF]|uniref:MBL fold metallo-hydrolase n=1 Tax=Paenibacillus sp. UNC499MF TaxID=1502751 RepID=UPI00089FF4AB|nr:MBL fold metallo-hydrolase [Paenibacillus sp. UNC499MF]SEF94094.1 ribonuclease Z [Paenibacillus sp. UNC499MF]
MELILMGTACASSGRDRDNTYLLLRDTDGSTLIDIGGNPLGKLKTLGLTTHEIKRVVFTHVHIDHIYGLPSLLWGMWIDGREDPLEIYCDESEKEWLQNWLELMRLTKWPVAFEISVRAFQWEEPALLWQKDETALSVFPSRHGVAAVGIKVEHNGTVFVYSTDTTPNPLIRDMARIDLLVHESTTAERSLAMHSTLRDIAGYYDWGKIGRGILVHLTDDEPYDELLKELPVGISSKISLGRELERIPLTGGILNGKSEAPE